VHDNLNKIKEILAEK